ncbi:3-dehydroquinate dehydratase [Anopheles sinensis]|uniref:3-dehydroquinate dehydratase n=1 Tax=Anopheles sinensis TaxID=74873 RepID=A0A084VGJ6_ANOSI|nr:3-dehydroquinate dehydratase [Anopheles sinensis]
MTPKEMVILCSFCSMLMQHQKLLFRAFLFSSRSIRLADRVASVIIPWSGSWHVTSSPAGDALGWVSGVVNASSGPRDAI